jgi:hypothetical protein
MNYLRRELDMSEKCKGALGWIFGHKFIDSVGNCIKNSEGKTICLRCGLER